MTMTDILSAHEDAHLEIPVRICNDSKDLFNSPDSAHLHPRMNKVGSCPFTLRLHRHSDPSLSRPSRTLDSIHTMSNPLRPVYPNFLGTDSSLVLLIRHIGVNVHAAVWLPGLPSSCVRAAL